jgi:hypothetical protein
MRIHHRLAVLSVVAAAVTTAWAVSAHFQFATGVVNDAGALVVAFKEAGLGNNVTAHYTLSTTVDATFQCFNNGSNAPQGQPFETPGQTLTVGGDFTSGKNGNIVGTLTAGPPDPAPAEAVLKCVSTSKKLCLMAVSYSGTTLTDDTFGTSTAVTPDPAERSFPAPTRRSPTPDNCITSL